MSLDHVLLGTLREPASGYDLKTRFDEVFRHFWPAELSQIYRTLKRLESEGLLSSKAAESEKGPERRVYRTTARGRAAVRKWLLGGPAISDDRHAFVAQTFFLDELPDPDSQESFLRALRDEFAARVAELEATEADWASRDPHFPDALGTTDLFAHFTLTLGRAKYGAIVGWADHCLARLAARTADGRAQTATNTATNTTGVSR